MTLGENIRKKRLEYDLQQEELAKRVGIKKAMLSLIERNKRKPSLDTLSKIADSLHCSIDELFGRKIS